MGGRPPQRIGRLPPQLPQQPIVLAKQCIKMRVGVGVGGWVCGVWVGWLCVCVCVCVYTMLVYFVFAPFFSLRKKFFSRGWILVVYCFLV
jgi:hypothetical protein